ncbi:MAG: tetratricopeptide repeat-containing sensor histidine kinase [Cyclobacteriaceae bacterium]|nr:tetratricopeptide repeat-containing sensor histidine kinase [Cyclobacteriaceae bacterium]
MMIRTDLTISILFKAYLVIGFVFYVHIAFSQNQNKADSLIQLLESGNVIEDTVKLKILRGIYKNQTNPDLKLMYAKKSLEISIKNNQLLWKYRSTLHIGHAYKLKGDLQKSLEAYFSCIQYAKKMKDKRREAITYSAIGSVYRVQNNYPSSLTYYNLGIIKLREINDSTNLARTLMNTGELYRMIHTLDTALIYFEEADKIFTLKNYKIGRAYNLGNIGLVYAEQGRHKLAEENIVEATKILHELGDNYPIAVYNTYMADIYKAKGDLPRALAYAQHSYSLAMADGLKEQIRDASHKLSELYEANQDFKSAYQYQEKYLTYRDSINSEETIRKMADLRTEYEVAQKQIEVDLLNQEKKTSRLIRAGLLGMIVLIAGLAFIYFKRNRDKRIINKLLTKQKEKLQIQHNELEVLNSTKDRFFSIISHDLRGPVNSFKGLTTIMKMSLDGKAYEDLPKINDMLDKASSQLSELLDNLLDWAVNQQGEFPYSPEKTSIEALVNGVLNTSKSRAESKRIKITTQFDDALFGWIDKNSVKTILRNLVNNALKFTPQGGKVEIIGMIEKDELVINIKDNGIGISKEKFANLFSESELKSTSGTDGEKGLGLGLRLAYDFAKMNKGSVSAESKEGVGTTFTLRLPVKR